MKKKNKFLNYLVVVELCFVLLLGTALAAKGVWSAANAGVVAENSASVTIDKQVTGKVSVAVTGSDNDSSDEVSFIRNEVVSGDKTLVIDSLNPKKVVDTTEHYEAVVITFTVTNDSVDNETMYVVCESTFTHLEGIEEARYLLTAYRTVDMNDESKDFPVGAGYTEEFAIEAGESKTVTYTIKWNDSKNGSDTLNAKWKISLSSKQAD